MKSLTSLSSLTDEPEEAHQALSHALDGEPGIADPGAFSGGPGSAATDLVANSRVAGRDQVQHWQSWVEVRLG